MPAVVLTDHAIERYRDRVKPGLGWRAALDDARAVLKACGEFTDERPSWVDACDDERYVMVGPDIVFPVYESATDGELVATTCLVRGGMSEDRRAAKKRRESKQRERQAERRRMRSLPKTARPRTS